MASSVIYCGNCGAQNAGIEHFCSSCGYLLTPSSVAATILPASPSTGQVQAHTLLRERYRVLQTIGQGGMGAVYLAQDTQLGNRPVAVKEMSQSNLYSQQAQDARENFRREAHLLAELQHPNLPSIHDYFEESGRWYLVMSFIQGETLEDYLGHVPNQQLPLEEVLGIGLDLCNVLNYLHTRQPPIIFRDLKPSNIMRSADGHIYLIDFGIARHFKPGQAKDTATYGSMGYAPPEQYGRAQTTERSDIYSLGATLYEMLSGYDPSQSPFHLPPFPLLVPPPPDQFVRLIMQMLEMDESKRPASIKVVQQALQQIAATPPSAPAPPRHYPPETPAVPTEDAPLLPLSGEYGQMEYSTTPSISYGMQSEIFSNQEIFPSRPRITVFRVIRSILYFIATFMAAFGLIGTFNALFGTGDRAEGLAIFFALGLLVAGVVIFLSMRHRVPQLRLAHFIWGILSATVGMVMAFVLAFTLAANPDLSFGIIFLLYGFVLAATSLW